MFDLASLPLLFCWVVCENTSSPMFSSSKELLIKPRLGQINQYKWRTRAALTSAQLLCVCVDMNVRFVGLSGLQSSLAIELAWLCPLDQSLSFLIGFPITEHFWHAPALFFLPLCSPSHLAAPLCFTHFHKMNEPGPPARLLVLNQISLWWLVNPTIKCGSLMSIFSHAGRGKAQV